MYKVYSRVYQQAFKVASRFVHWRKPELLEGENSLLDLPTKIKETGIDRVLMVTDEGVWTSGMVQPLLTKLDEEGIVAIVYDKTVPNPTIENIEQAYELYTANMCKGIVAFGGGSPMDCAKGVAIRVVRPEKPVSYFKGTLKVRKEMPPFFAVPTTAGTGSEATVAAVISNPETAEKYAISDPVLIPHVAVLDPLLTISLPPHITAITGMDALTHAVEAYIGKSNTAETKHYSIAATQLIFNNLYQAYEDGTNLEARKNMQQAAYFAGIAFTRAYVGYVHAVAHTLGGFYQVPHGLANAVLLPYVLELYGESVYEPLAELATAVGIEGKSDAEKAQKFITEIQALNQKMAIPTKIDRIKNRDIAAMIDRAWSEAHPLYPVPRFLSKDELFYLYQVIQP